jgi:hypothetical protein
MTVIPPDPDPTRTPSLEPGGGVAPGDLPPDSAQTSGLSAHQPAPRQRLNAATVFGVITLTVFILLFVTTAVLIFLNLVV